MSVTTALIAASGAQLASGFMGMQAAGEQADALRQEGALTFQDYVNRANKTRTDAQSFRAQQTVSYLKSGVQLEGTPLAVLAETAARAEDTANALITRGRAEASLAQRKASIAEQQGRAGFLAGIGQAVGLAARG